jgi:protein arginine kinase
MRQATVRKEPDKTMVEALLDRLPRWLAGDGPESGIVLATRVALERNLADFPFPGRCGESDLAVVEERAQTAFESIHLLRQGQYFPLKGSDRRENRLLVERRLTTERHVDRRGPRGLYVSDDQCVSILVNEVNHVRIQVMASGLNLQKAWARATALDDALAGMLDYAFDSRFGYLTASLTTVGTGLGAHVMLHLPALAAQNRIVEMEQELRSQYHGLGGVLENPGKVRGEASGSSGETEEEPRSQYQTVQGGAGNVGDAPGDLYELSNLSTLGRSEEEILFHVRHRANEVIRAEKEARRELLDEQQLTLEDRIYRAANIVHAVRLLEFDEAAGLLSSLRMGLTLGLLDSFTVRQLNETLIACQRGHLEAKTAQPCDDLTLSAERAELFRARFS